MGDILKGFKRDPKEGFQCIAIYIYNTFNK